MKVLQFREKLTAQIWIYPKTKKSKQILANHESADTVPQTTIPFETLFELTMNLVRDISIIKIPFLRCYGNAKAVHGTVCTLILVIAANFRIQ
jgi:hypothetical protein